MHGKHTMAFQSNGLSTTYYCSHITHWRMGEYGEMDEDRCSSTVRILRGFSLCVRDLHSGQASHIDLHRTTRSTNRTYARLAGPR